MSPAELRREHPKDNASLLKDPPGEGSHKEIINDLRKSAEQFTSNKSEIAFDFLEKLFVKESSERKTQPLMHLSPEKKIEALNAEKKR